MTGKQLAYIGGGALLGYMLGKQPWLTALLGAGLGWYVAGKPIPQLANSFASQPLQLTSENLKQFADVQEGEVLEPDEVTTQSMGGIEDYDPFLDEFGGEYS